MTRNNTEIPWTLGPVSPEGNNSKKHTGVWRAGYWHEYGQDMGHFQDHLPHSKFLYPRHLTPAPSTASALLSFSHSLKAPMTWIWTICYIPTGPWGLFTYSPSVSLCYSDWVTSITSLSPPFCCWAPPPGFMFGITCFSALYFGWVLLYVFYFFAKAFFLCWNYFFHLSQTCS